MMKLYIGLLMVAFCVGCDSTNHTEYQLSGPLSSEGERVSVTVADRAEVKDALQKVATQLKFVDRSQVSIMTNAIALWVQQETHNPVRIAAWESKGTIQTEVTHTPTSLGETEYYRKVQDLVFSELQTRFGSRVTVPARQNLPSNTPSRRRY